MSARQVWQSIRKRYQFVIAFTVAGLVIGLGVAILSPRLYAASISMYIATQGNTDNVTFAYQGGMLSQQRARTYSELVTGDRIAADVIRQLQLPDTITEFQNRISASSQLESVLIVATVTDPSPDEAARIANSVGSNFTRLVAELEQPLDRARNAPVAAKIVQPATISDGPVSPRRTLDIFGGFAIGILLGLAFAIIRGVADNRIHSREDLLEVATHPILGSIVFDRGVEQDVLYLRSRPESPISEETRQLRTNLGFVEVDSKSKSLVITSSGPNEGKSVLVCNLAWSMAEAGESVLVVEADLRRPRVADHFDVARDVGLTTCLTGRSVFSEVLSPVRPGLDVLTSGPLPPNPSELVSSRAMQSILEEAKARYSFVLIDSPPLGPVTDAAVIATLADGAVILVREGVATKKQLGSSIEALAAVSAKLFGLVMTMVSTSEATRYGGYGYYSERGAHGSSSSRGSGDRGARRSGVEPGKSRQAGSRSRDVSGRSRG